MENEAVAIVPLYGALYSQKAPDFQSENEEIKTAFSQVAAACYGRGVWVVDRGGVRRELYNRICGRMPIVLPFSALGGAIRGNPGFNKAI